MGGSPQPATKTAHQLSEANQADLGQTTEGSNQPTAKTVRQAKKQLATVERRLARLRTEHEQLMAAMVGVDPADYATLTELTSQLKELDQTIVAAEEQWLDLGETSGL